MNIHVYDPYIENKFDEYEYDFSNLTTALCNADCISLNLPKVDKPIITRKFPIFKTWCSYNKYCTWRVD